MKYISMSYTTKLGTISIQSKDNVILIQQNREI